MYEDYTKDAEGDLADNSEDDEIPVMATILDLQVLRPEVNENYVKSSVIFPRGNTYDRGKVIGQKIYTSGNFIIRMKDNPILDMHEYCVEFDDGEVSELMSNVITESMYAACDDSGNEYLMMD